jgi:uncharacterized protein YjaG (DUF416 family)
LICWRTKKYQLLTKSLLLWQKQQKKIKKIICHCGDFDFNALPAVDCCASLLEAHDIIEMEEIERDLLLNYSQILKVLQKRNTTKLIEHETFETNYPLR